MKKTVLLGFLILFLLSTTTFAAFTDTKKGSEASPVTRENKLSEEELSRMNKRAETDNISKVNLSDKAMNDSKNLKAPNQVIVENRHHGYYYGGAALILIVILVIVLL